MKALEFNVKDLYENELSVHEVLVSASEIGLDIIEEVEFVKPIQSRVQLLRHDLNVYVKANFSASMVSECSRCIEPVEIEISAETELHFCRTETLKKIDPLLIDGGERHYSGDIMDLSEDARQVITLEVPPWPLCSESCEGLCSRCGTNLNMAECDCHDPKVSDSPFAVLADLLNTTKRAVGE